MGIQNDQPYMPKLGEVCEAVDYDCGNGEYYQRVIFIGDNPKDSSKAFSCLDDGCLFWSDKFRPLKTEREKFIEMIIRDSSIESENESCVMMIDKPTAERLIDSGWRPEKQA